jgi:hypothetical protein
MSSQSFSTFSVILLVLGHPERLSFSTDTQLALKRECHSKTIVRVKRMFSKSLKKRFKGFSSGFTELHAKLDADTFLNFAIHCKRNETQSQKKHSFKNNACSQCGVTWQTDAIGFRKCDLGLPSQLLLPRQLQQ